MAERELQGLLVDFAREASDTIAERMRALDAVPDGRSDTVAASTTLPQFPAYEHSTTEVVDLITGRTYAAVDTIRTVHDSVDAEDPPNAAEARLATPWARASRASSLPALPTRPSRRSE